jgi:hypothetical protein
MQSGRGPEFLQLRRFGGSGTQQTAAIRGKLLQAMVGMFAHASQATKVVRPKSS